MRSTARRAGLALSLVLIMASSGLTPRPSPAFELFPRTTLAANETVTDCVEASFDAALRAVQDNGGGTVRLECKIGRAHV